MGRARKDPPPRKDFPKYSKPINRKSSSSWPSSSKGGPSARSERITRASQATRPTGPPVDFDAASPSDDMNFTWDVGNMTNEPQQADQTRDQTAEHKQRPSEDILDDARGHSTNYDPANSSELQNWVERMDHDGREGRPLQDPVQDADGDHNMDRDTTTPQRHQSPVPLPVTDRHRNLTPEQQENNSGLVQEQDALFDPVTLESFQQTSAQASYSNPVSTDNIGGEGSSTSSEDDFGLSAEDHQLGERLWKAQMQSNNQNLGTQEETSGQQVRIGDDHEMTENRREGSDSDAEGSTCSDSLYGDSSPARPTSVPMDGPRYEIQYPKPSYVKPAPLPGLSTTGAGSSKVPESGLFSRLPYAEFDPFRSNFKSGYTPATMPGYGTSSELADARPDHVAATPNAASAPAPAPTPTASIETEHDTKPKPTHVGSARIPVAPDADVPKDNPSMHIDKLRDIKRLDISMHFEALNARIAQDPAKYPSLLTTVEQLHELAQDYEERLFREANCDREAYFTLITFNLQMFKDWRGITLDLCNDAWSGFILNKFPDHFGVDVAAISQRLKAPLRGKRNPIAPPSGPSAPIGIGMQSRPQLMNAGLTAFKFDLPGAFGIKRALPGPNPLISNGSKNLNVPMLATTDHSQQKFTFAAAKDGMDFEMSNPLKFEQSRLNNIPPIAQDPPRRRLFGDLQASEQKSDTYKLFANALRNPLPKQTPGAKASLPPTSQALPTRQAPPRFDDAPEPMDTNDAVAELQPKTPLKHTTSSSSDDEMEITINNEIVDDGQGKVHDDIKVKNTHDQLRSNVQANTADKVDDKTEGSEVERTQNSFLGDTAMGENKLPDTVQDKPIPIVETRETTATTEDKGYVDPEDNPGEVVVTQSEAAVAGQVEGIQSPVQEEVNIAPVDAPSAKSEPGVAGKSDVSEAGAEAASESLNSLFEDEVAIKDEAVDAVDVAGEAADVPDEVLPPPSNAETTATNKSVDTIEAISNIKDTVDEMPVPPPDGKAVVENQVVHEKDAPMAAPPSGPSLDSTLDSIKAMAHGFGEIKESFASFSTKMAAYSENLATAQERGDQIGETRSEVKVLSGQLSDLRSSLKGLDSRFEALEASSRDAATKAALEKALEDQASMKATIESTQKTLQTFQSNQAELAARVEILEKLPHMRKEVRRNIAAKYKRVNDLMASAPNFRQEFFLSEEDMKRMSKIVESGWWKNTAGDPREYQECIQIVYNKIDVISIIQLEVWYDHLPREFNFRKFPSATPEAIGELHKPKIEEVPQPEIETIAQESAPLREDYKSGHSPVSPEPEVSNDNIGGLSTPEEPSTPETKSSDDKESESGKGSPKGKEADPDTQPNMKVVIDGLLNTTLTEKDVRNSIEGYFRSIMEPTSTESDLSSAVADFNSFYSLATLWPGAMQRLPELSKPDTPGITEIFTIAFEAAKKMVERPNIMLIEKNYNGNAAVCQRLVDVLNALAAVDENALEWEEAFENDCQRIRQLLGHASRQRTNCNRDDWNDEWRAEASRKYKTNRARASKLRKRAMSVVQHHESLGKNFRAQLVRLADNLQSATPQQAVIHTWIQSMDAHLDPFEAKYQAKLTEIYKEFNRV